MSSSANVHSVEAILVMRAALASFADRVNVALTELTSEMRRVQEWLEHDRPRHWKVQVRRAMDEVHEAQQALHRCLMFPIAGERPACDEERAALKRARARLAYCEEKSDRVRYWQRTLRHELFEYQGRISQLVRLVDVEVPQAVAVLDKVVRHVQDYEAVSAQAPSAGYNDVHLAQELWPDQPARGDAERDDASSNPSEVEDEN